MAKTKATWESSVEYHMDKLGYYLEEKIPFHLGRLAKLSDTHAMDKAVEAMDDLCEKFVDALDAFEKSIGTKPDDEKAEEEEEVVMGRVMKNPEDEDGEDDEEEEEEGDEESEEDNGEDLVNEIFGD